MRHHLILILVAATWLVMSCDNAQAGGMASGATVAVIDFDYQDTSGEERDQRKMHEGQLSSFMDALRSDLRQGAGLQLVTLTCHSEPCSFAGTPVPDLLAAAREAGADILLIGGVHKMSTLVQWTKIEAIDTKTEQPVFDKLFTFRGDTDEAWRRAETFIFHEISAAPTRADQVPIKIAPAYRN